MRARITGMSNLISKLETPRIGFRTNSKYGVFTQIVMQRGLSPSFVQFQCERLSV